MTLTVTAEDEARWMRRNRIDYIAASRAGADGTRSGEVRRWLYRDGRVTMRVVRATIAPR